MGVLLKQSYGKCEIQNDILLLCGLSRETVSLLLEIHTKFHSPLLYWCGGRNASDGYLKSLIIQPKLSVWLDTTRGM